MSSTADQPHMSPRDVNALYHKNARDAENHWRAGRFEDAAYHWRIVVQCRRKIAERLNLRATSQGSQQGHSLYDDGHWQALLNSDKWLDECTNHVAFENRSQPLALPQTYLLLFRQCKQSDRAVDFPVAKGRSWSGFKGGMRTWQAPIRLKQATTKNLNECQALPPLRLGLQFSAKVEQLRMSS